jgi:hypothetical protein
MIRRLVNFLTALSLLLLVPIVAMWVRSAFTSDVWTRGRVTRAEVITDYVVSREGGVLLRRTRQGTGGLSYTPIPTEGRWQHNAGFFMVPAWVLPRVATTLSMPGLRFGRLVPVPTPYTGIAVYDAELEFRYWLAALVAAAPLAAWAPTFLRARRRRRRRIRGRCVDCGYDLRGGNERCPECGAAVVAPAS